MHRLFNRGETWAICREALAANGPMTTKELVEDLYEGPEATSGRQGSKPRPPHEAGQFPREAGICAASGPGRQAEGRRYMAAVPGKDSDLTRREVADHITSCYNERYAEFDSLSLRTF